jgi:selenocysteine lyase/cysteine desulfurase
LSCSAYKFYGPHLGVLYGRENLLTALDFPKLAPAPDSAPERAETGTQNHEGIAGAAAAVDFLASLAPTGTRRQRLEATFAGLRERGRELVRQLWQGLNEIEGVKIYGPPPNEPRTPTIGFTIAGLTSTEAARALADEAVFVSNGDFYATTLVERLGQAGNGLVRAGCACYTTEEEVARLIDGVRRLAAAKR